MVTEGPCSQRWYVTKLFRVVCITTEGWQGWGIGGGTVCIRVGTTFVVGVGAAIGGRAMAEPLWVGSSSDSIVLKGLGDSEARNGARQASFKKIGLGFHMGDSRVGISSCSMFSCIRGCEAPRGLVKPSLLIAFQGPKEF